MQVYIVLVIGTGKIVGVFSTQEKAQAYIARLPASFKLTFREYTVQ